MFACFALMCVHGTYTHKCAYVCVCGCECFLTHTCFQSVGVDDTFAYLLIVFSLFFFYLSCLEVARVRLAEFRCRMARRGVGAGPVMPDFCLLPGDGVFACKGKFVRVRVRAFVCACVLWAGACAGACAERAL